MNDLEPVIVPPRGMLPPIWWMRLRITWWRFRLWLDTRTRAKE